MGRACGPHAPTTFGDLQSYHILLMVAEIYAMQLALVCQAVMDSGGGSYYDTRV